MLELLEVLWDAFTDSFAYHDYDEPPPADYDYHSYYNPPPAISDVFANYPDNQDALYDVPPAQPSPRTNLLPQSGSTDSIQHREEFSHMAHVTYNYKGRSYSFAFEYTHSDADGYRAYIVTAPGYGGRSENLHSTHRLRDGSRYYICWSEKITTVAQMDAVAELWSKATVMYIANGGSSLDQYAEKILRAEAGG